MKRFFITLIFLLFANFVFAGSLTDLLNNLPPELKADPLFERLLYYAKLDEEFAERHGTVAKLDDTIIQWIRNSRMSVTAARELNKGSAAVVAAEAELAKVIAFTDKIKSSLITNPSFASSHLTDYERARLDYDEAVRQLDQNPEDLEAWLKFRSAEKKLKIARDAQEAASKQARMNTLMFREAYEPTRARIEALEAEKRQLENALRNLADDTAVAPTQKIVKGIPMIEKLRDWWKKSGGKVKKWTNLIRRADAADPEEELEKAFDNWDYWKRRRAYYEKILQEKPNNIQANAEFLEARKKEREARKRLDDAKKALNTDAVIDRAATDLAVEETRKGTLADQVADDVATERLRQLKEKADALEAEKKQLTETLKQLSDNEVSAPPVSARRIRRWAWVDGFADFMKKYRIRFFR